MGQVFTELELHQAVTDELAKGQPTALEIVELPGSGHEFDSDHIWVCLAICHPFGHDVPDDHQQFASDSYNCFAAFHVSVQLLEVFFPVGMSIDSDPGCFNQCPAQFSPPLFGDMTRMMGLATWTIVGLDESRQMGLLTKVSMARAGSDMPNLTRAVAGILPFPEQSFDSVVATSPNNLHF